MNNPACPPAALQRALRLASTSEDLMIRRTVARHPECPPDVQEVLARDSVAAVRDALAANPSTIPAVLTWLAADEDEYVRGTVMKNPSCPPEARFVGALNG